MREIVHGVCEALHPDRQADDVWTLEREFSDGTAACARYIQAIGMGGNLPALVEALKVAQRPSATTAAMVERIHRRRKLSLSCSASNGDCCGVDP